MNAGRKVEGSTTRFREARTMDQSSGGAAFRLNVLLPTAIDCLSVKCSLCRPVCLAALLDMPLVAAAQNVVSIAKTSSEAVERLRSWASGRCLSADQPGIYKRSTERANQPRQRFKVDPSSN